MLSQIRNVEEIQMQNIMVEQEEEDGQQVAADSLSNDGHLVSLK